MEDYVQEIIVPKARASFLLSAAIEFPRSVLLPMVEGANGLEVDQTLDVSGHLKSAYFKMADAYLDFDLQTGFGYQMEFQGTLFPTYCKIGNTPLILSFSGGKLDLSRTSNIPEADAAGFPVDFVGMYIKQAYIGFQGFGDDDTTRTSIGIRADNLLIGTGGVSGKIALEANGSIFRKFNDFAIELNEFSITFRQNVIIGSNIRGKLTLTKFTNNGVPVEIGIAVSFDNKGDFSITLDTNALPALTLPNVFTLHLEKLKFGKELKGYYFEMAGQLDFIVDLDIVHQIMPQGIHIDKLRIWDNGDLDFAGGGLRVPKAFYLNIPPVSMEVTDMSLGPYTRKLKKHQPPGTTGPDVLIDRKYLYFGFDGMINAGTAGFGVRGNGIKYYFTIDNNSTDKPFDQFMSIDGIAIDITVPSGAKENAIFTLQGYLGMKNPQNENSRAGVEYTGSVKFALPLLKLSGSAAMRLQPAVPNYIVDAGIEFATPIPLGATGLGIYGFRGLFGKHYIPSKTAVAGLTESSTWWDYYKAKSTITNHEGIEIDKFADEPGYSIGAGVSIATSFDSGLIFSVKIFLLLNFPDTFLLQGQAGILRSRIGLNDPNDPPFSAFIALSKSSFEAKFGVDYNVPSSGGWKGKIFSLSGTLDVAFYFNHASGWHINLGVDQPENLRIRAQVLTLFSGYAYVMLSSQGIKAGAGAKYEFKRKFGPAFVEIGAYVDLSAFLSFKPVQIGGRIEFGGRAVVGIWFVHLGLSVRVYLAVEAPHPFIITGGLEVSVKIIFKRIRVKIDITWTFNKHNDELLEPLPVLALPNAATGYLPAVATNILSEETFQLNYVTNENSLTIPNPGSSAWAISFVNEETSGQVTIPLDSFIDIELLKPVKPIITPVGALPDPAVTGNVSLGSSASQIASAYMELLPPQKGKSDQVKHEFELKQIDIFAWKGDTTSGEWVAYNVYEAVTAIVESNTGPSAIALNTLKQGYWQLVEPNKYNKIRLLSQNMFSYLTEDDNVISDMDARNFPKKALFCYDAVLGKTIVDWKNELVDTVYDNDQTQYFKAVPFTIIGMNASVKADLSVVRNDLYLDGYQGSIKIDLPQPVSAMELKFGANENDITIKFITTTYYRTLFGIAIPILSETGRQQVGRTEQDKLIGYNDITKPIHQVLINFNEKRRLNYTGNLVIGGHIDLPTPVLGTLSSIYNTFELPKALLYVSFYTRSYSAQEVINKLSRDQTDLAGQWPMISRASSTGNHPGLVTGTPDRVAAFFAQSASGQNASNDVYLFNSSQDALLVPFFSGLLVENSNFSFQFTVAVNPWIKGVRTLLYKINHDTSSGYSKGYSVHLVQRATNARGTIYNALADVPSFSVVLSCYHELSSWSTEVTDQYAIDCSSKQLSENQFKNIFISIDRQAGKISIYLDKVLKATVDIPGQLAVYSSEPTHTYLREVNFMSTSLHQRVIDNPVTEAHVIDEVKILSDGLDRTVQPVWRPNTIFAVRVRTQDKVNGTVPTSPPGLKTHIFGFKTAGPVGHFHQRNPKYKELAESDRASEFKLANLKHYIDFERSYPDAQGRFNLSKPVFWHLPQVKLFFVKPYINAMFADWAAYQNLPPVSSSLELVLLDTYGNATTEQLVWEPVKDALVTDDNYLSLPPDQRALYLMNKIAAQANCYSMPTPIRKRLKQGAYSFPDLQPGKLYTALFSAIYQPSGAAIERNEVHRFGFLTSRYASFTEQVRSFILNYPDPAPVYAAYVKNVFFSPAEIESRLKLLIDNNLQNDPPDTLRYATRFDRLIYGGLQITDWLPVGGTVITVFNNIVPSTGSASIMGVLVRNPEPFNDPKLAGDLLADTVGLSLTLSDNSVQAESGFIYIHSADTSSVFITNSQMAIPAGKMKLRFRHKIFDGDDFNTLFDEYETPLIDIAPQEL
ncbi:hypothetical protein [Mucilaginibacter psychrotolerans]|uniref:Uncharacterized protein n=1 Tax=Mucilaginibacter psychrotolerans TaxID=1524096 RepID=A0A4Y8S685_9SPHI|nr:hypothetical protein [Mucilaginibacter psychrotolerans]TFF33977.1 hypothetical protein E2R66_23645 [Mucilaginibacter psychrotolerans]